MSSKNKTTDTKEATKSGLVPKLRFPEFREAGRWQLKLLGSLFSQREEIGYTNLRLLSLMDKEGIIPQEESNRKNSASGDLSKYLRVASGDIAYNTMRMWEGRSALSKLEGIVSPAYTICRPAQGTNSLFFSYYFKTPQLIAEFARYSQGLVKDTLNLKFDAFARIPAATPCDLAEQKKIAECLSSADEVIASQARKVDALRTHKKGLMQQLFPREGKTQPRLRFPKFRNAADWVSDSLGTIFETTSGGTPSRTEKAYWNGKIPWITTSLVDFRVITSAEEFLTADGLANSSAKLFPKGTVLMAMYGQGKTRGQVALLGIEAATNQACAAILPRKGIDPYFVYTNLAGRYDEVRGMSNSGGQENLSQGLIREMQFAFPPDTAEQRKVTSCLSSFDALVTAETQKLEALKIHKKGLMQQLFPSPDEIEA
ncbi:restriction endonuclease subunit S [Variovorax paradoxus]|uniref:restriction endonuclease subunit S n=1 Tax=Variovorax paradoxus TaxID=34073 RepID=UPI002786D196|nr:restriction endonuclease subunit S [Variovorax paradoxus]MDQ0587911.1 type I restriction enzyme S subunit [Variovorax paradoxus]